MRFRNKADWVARYTKNKNVLDLGCVDGNLNNTDKKNWLHGVIKKNAKSVLGVDCLEDAVFDLQNKGYNVICDDVEKLELGKTFDIIVAGDIIEHLSNFGLFFESIQTHLKKSGTVLISTPNPLTLPRFIRLLMFGWAGGGDGHTCWFTRKNMRELSSRYGFEVVELAYVDDVYRWYLRAGWHYFLLALPVLALNYLMCLIAPRMSETYCYTLKKKHV